MLQERLLLLLPNSCLGKCMLLFPKTFCLFGWRKYFWPLGLICCVRPSVWIATMFYHHEIAGLQQGGEGCYQKGMWELLGGGLLWELSSPSNLEGEGKRRGRYILPRSQPGHECTRHKRHLNAHWAYLITSVLWYPAITGSQRSYILGLILEISPSWMPRILPRFLQI